MILDPVGRCATERAKGKEGCGLPGAACGHQRAPSPQSPESCRHASHLHGVIGTTPGEQGRESALCCDNPAPVIAPPDLCRWTGVECEICTRQDAEGSAGCRVLCWATDKHPNQGGGIFSFRKEEKTQKRPISRCLGVPHGEASAHLTHPHLSQIHVLSALLMKAPGPFRLHLLDDVIPHPVLALHTPASCLGIAFCHCVVSAPPSLQPGSELLKAQGCPQHLELSRP